AAAMKFLSSADLVWHWGIFTREVVLAIWIVLGILIVLYIVGLFRFAHDAKPERVGMVRMTGALAFLALIAALVPGLFGRPLGEVDSFLPPSIAELNGRQAAENVSGGVIWIQNDYEGALAKARLQSKRVFIDF